MWAKRLGVLLLCVSCILCSTGCSLLEFVQSETVETTVVTTTEVPVNESEPVEFAHEPVYRRMVHDWVLLADGVEYSLMGRDTILLCNKNNYAISYNFRRGWFKGILYGHSSAVLFMGHTDLSDCTVEEWEITPWTTSVDTSNTQVIDALRTGIECKSFDMTSDNRLHAYVQVEPHAELGENTIYAATFDFVFFHGNRNLGTQSLTALFDTSGGAYTYTFDVKNYIKQAQQNDIAFYMIVREVRVLTKAELEFNEELEGENDLIRWGLYKVAGTMNDYKLIMRSVHAEMPVSGACLYGETVNGDFFGAPVRLNTNTLKSGILIHADITLPRNIFTDTLQLHVCTPKEEDEYIGESTVFDKADEDEEPPIMQLYTGRAAVHDQTVNFRLYNLTDAPVKLTSLDGMLLNAAGEYTGLLSEVVQNYRILDITGDDLFIDAHKGLGSVECIIPARAVVEVWLLSYDLKASICTDMIPSVDGVIVDEVSMEDDEWETVED